MKKTVGENLKVFRKRSGLSMEEAGKKLNMSAPAILKFEKNKIIASLSRLEAFAKVYNVTVEDILNVEESIDVKFTNFKCDNKISKAKKEMIKSIIEDKIDNYFDLLRLSNITLQNKFGIHIINSLEEAESLATKLRIYFTLPIDEPISNLIYLLERHGIMILTIPRDEVTKDFIGFYEIVGNVPIIAVLEADNGYEQRFNIAKFLGELLIVSNKNKDLLTTRFALSLLVPKQSLVKEFGMSRSKTDFREIEIFSNIYLVSYKNVVKRLLDANIITNSNAKYTNIFINKQKIKENIYYEEANNYNKMLYRLYAEGLIKDLKKYL